jgi:hypothetical protein
MENEIEKVSKDIIKIIHRCSILSKATLDSKRQETWLKTLQAIKENLSDYEDVLAPKIPSIEESLANVVNHLNELSDEERAIFITSEQMDMLNFYIIKDEIKKIDEFTKNVVGLECEYTLSPEAVPYVEKIQEILENKRNCNVNVYKDKLHINWYHD